MNDQEISAFEAYTKKKELKKKTKKKLGLEAKSKMKFTNKKKKYNNSINAVKSILNKSKELENGKKSVENNLEKSMEKNKIFKTLIKSEVESMLEGCNVTTDVSDILSETNGVSNKKQKVEDSSIKKVKKKKISNGENFTDKKSEFVEKKIDSNKPKKKKSAKLKKFNSDSSLIYGDSTKMGEQVFSWLLSPLSLNKFFDFHWEKKPLLIKRNNENFYNSICTLKDIKKALRENDMYFTKNVDVTSYVNGLRTTENPEGKATLSTVWDFLGQGKSIRLLNPQSFIPNIRLLNTTLQEYFQCFVGANVYLTPAGTQGFAPHYDDIEAFVLQLEGVKHWKLYSPRVPEEYLPRYSSENFDESQVGEPIMDVVLNPGDLLYFPRGFIHQAKCLPDTYSLHVTVSCYQRNSWADLFEKIFPVALEAAIAEDVELRKGLPIGYLNHLGMIFSDCETEFRRKMIEKFDRLSRRIFKFFPLDAAADQLGVDFIRDSLPPQLSEGEKLHGANRNGRNRRNSFYRVLKSRSDKNLGVKLIRANSIRLVSEGGEVYLYYNTDNSFVYRENEASRVVVPVHWIPAIENLIREYPKFVETENLPVMVDDDNSKGKRKRISELIYFLWQRGLILFDKPESEVFA